MTADITVVIPSIPPRAELLKRALASVTAQTLSPVRLIVEFDLGREGPAVLRNRALERVDTEYVAFLDDDDELLPQHLELLHETAVRESADLVYPWFTIVDSEGCLRPDLDPLGRFGLPFDPDIILNQANYIPVTVLARTSVVRAAGGFNVLFGHNPCEDWGCWQAMVRAGARFVHLPERTWLWHWHGANTSGLTTRW